MKELNNNAESLTKLKNLRFFILEYLESAKNVPFTEKEFAAIKSFQTAKNIDELELTNSSLVLEKLAGKLWQDIEERIESLSRLNSEFEYKKLSNLLTTFKKMQWLESYCPAYASMSKYLQEQAQYQVEQLNKNATSR